MRLSPYYLLAILAGIVWYGQACTRGSSNGVADHTGTENMPDRVSYNFDIRPILSDKCLVCHGPNANKHEAGLRLDMAERHTRLYRSTHPRMPSYPESPTCRKCFCGLLRPIRQP